MMATAAYIAIVATYSHKVTITLAKMTQNLKLFWHNLLWCFPFRGNKLVRFTATNIFNIGW
jgi:hypothetical protein